MRVLFGKIIVAVVSVIFLAGCGSNNAEGGYGDQIAARIAANIGVEPDEFSRATVEQVESRLEKVWTSSNGRLKIGTFTAEGERDRYLSVNGNGRIGRWSARADSLFDITGINENGTIDVRFNSGKVCLSDGTEDRRCSTASRGSGTLTMYISDNYPNNIGLFLDYTIRGREMRLNSSNRYSGEWNGTFHAILER